jgi:hypothetical protein
MTEKNTFFGQHSATEAWKRRLDSMHHHLERPQSLTESVNHDSYISPKYCAAAALCVSLALLLRITSYELVANSQSAVTWLIPAMAASYRAHLFAVFRFLQKYSTLLLVSFDINQETCNHLLSNVSICIFCKLVACAAVQIQRFHPQKCVQSTSM